jgi:PhnB protein
MQLNPYLMFKGNCEAAFKFYAQSLGGKITVMLTHAETEAAAQVPAEWRNKIIHARMQLGDTDLMGSDAPPEHQAEMKGFSVSLTAANSAEAERMFNALAVGATVLMPLQQTFFASRFGMLTDQFGVPWMIGALPNT